MGIEEAATAAEREPRVRVVTLVWFGTGALLLAILALVGVAMRFTQGFGVIPDRWFFALLTLHGDGMVAVSLMVIAAVYWYLMSSRLPVSPSVMWLVYGLTMIGVVLVLVATMVGTFGTGWYFLYPLPTHPGPIPGWSAHWTVPFLLGLALVVIAFAIWSLDFLRAGIAQFGSLGKLFGLDILSGRSKPGDPGTADPSIIAGAVMSISGLITALPGAVIVVLMLINAFAPTFNFSALLAKELIFFTGHMLVNIEIYLGAGIAYAVLPAYTGRQWKAARVVVLALLLTMLFIMLPFFHHLYEDFAQPTALDVVGNVGSYTSAVPVVVITVFGGLLLVYRSGMRWRPAPLLIIAAMAGWVIGGFGAVIDSTPAVNQYFHNTLWVPAHFHTYMALGVILFILGGVYHAVPRLTGRTLADQRGKLGATIILIGGWGVVLVFFLSGVLSVPRRYGHVAIPKFENLARAGFVFGLIAFVGILVILVDLWPAFMGKPAPASAPQAGAEIG